MINWQVLLATIAGGLIAGLTGLIVQLVVESRKNRIKKHADLGKLIAYLLAFENEIENNLDVDIRKLSSISTHSSDKLLSTQIRKDCLFNLGEMPIREATEAMKYLLEIYAVFDQINLFLSRRMIENAIETFNSHIYLLIINTDGIRVLARRVEKRLYKRIRSDNYVTPHPHLEHTPDTNKSSKNAWHCNL